MPVLVLVPTERGEGVTCEGELDWVHGSAAGVPGGIVAANPASDNRPKGSYTVGTNVVVQHDAHRCWTGRVADPRACAHGSLADAPGFSTDALMRRKAGDRRREHRCSE
jgi:hypothetical protein